MQLRGAVAVVTGASSGIGETTAVYLARRGAKVVLAARRMERLEELQGRIERAGGTALALACDVGDPDQLKTLATVAREAFGPPDILVNNAGIPGRGGFEDIPYEEIEKIVRVNVLGVMYGTRAFLPGMLEHGRGHIVNIASLAGLFAAPGIPLYAATKHAVVAFSESLNYDVEKRGVLVTAVNPGFVATEGFPQEHRDQRFVLPMERVGKAIIRVLEEGIAPELSIPRWVSPLQGFRVLTPSLYRWGVRKVRDGNFGTKD
jgi:short-subunit dehydrogenase